MLGKDKIKDFISLTRLRNLPFILEIIAGAFLAVSFDFQLLDFSKLFLVLISFQILYAAIYVNNDIFDLKEDLKDKIKSQRPLPAGRIKRREALIFSLFLTSLALLLAIMFIPALAAFELIFLVFNIFILQL
ncbi:MAG: UbiA prenyltransferase [candidate division CPR2 bacterium GW2011_GWC1_39_9]|uniref:UbiA prenyltransferase n=1 Tax=candidate division CPR2 bacterium GW2011_GWC2_39_10 TaxID=1618345 RepID=A0A0G0P8I4_UNCC2|nr:MAG: UbiA prenyltransferase [candidate division CPR2 bacterium GW2011_GWC2_39_10]KKR34733.1 MAG: UbiA prenyltransferase [candidate division CPR2 bacterium GW2011_GWC1_39_9]